MNPKNNVCRAYRRQGVTLDADGKIEKWHY